MHTMQIELNGAKANAEFREITLETGAGAPTPLELFVASLGTCAALTAGGYCRKQGLTGDGLKINIDIERHPETRLVTDIKMEYIIPAGFPTEHVDALIAAAGKCFVKEHLYTPPTFTTVVTKA